MANFIFFLPDVKEKEKKMNRKTDSQKCLPIGRSETTVISTRPIPRPTSRYECARVGATGALPEFYSTYSGDAGDAAG
jgi:hypothetical protein